MLLKARHQWIAGIHPYFRKRPFFYIAQFIMPPEGVGMDVAQVVDIGDIDAGGIAAPLFQFGFDVFGFDQGNAGLPSAENKPHRRRYCR